MKRLLCKNDKLQVTGSVNTNSGFFSVLKKLSMALIILLISATLHAQVVMELKSYIEQMKASADPAAASNAAHLEKLVKDIQPTVYINNTIVANGELQPVCANVKSASIDQLRSDNPLFSGVELIRIRLNSPADLNFILDLSNLPGFTKLKYVYFLCEFKCGIEDIQKLFIPKSGITVIYMVSIPS
jgi:hypothetical protein